MKSTRVASVVGLVSLATAGAIMASATSGVMSHQGITAGQTGSALVKASTLSPARGLDYSATMFMVMFWGRGESSSIPTSGDARYMGA